MSTPRYIVQVAPDHADAALVALCNEADRLHYRTERAGDPMTRDAAADERVRADVSTWHDLVEKITFTPAITPEGIRAKAEVLAPVVALNEPSVASIVSDILGRKVGDLTDRGRARYRRIHKAT
jgi:hypothetical protein